MNVLRSLADAEQRSHLLTLDPKSRRHPWRGHRALERYKEITRTLAYARDPDVGGKANAQRR